MATNNNNKALKVPHLRFPEFTGEWCRITLKEAIKVQGGYAFKSEMFQKSGIPIVRISNLPQNESFVNLDECVYYLEGKYSNFEIQKGELLIAMSGATIGKTAIYNYDSPAYLNQRIGCFKIKDKIHYPYLYSLVASKTFKEQLATKLIAGAQPNISSTDIESIKVLIPKVNEQQKIATFLSLIEKRITTQNKIIEKLETLIKALSHKLTTQQRPNTRLKDCLTHHSSTLLENDVKGIGQYPVYGATGICGYMDKYEISGDSILIIKDGASVGSTAYATGRYSTIGTLNYLRTTQECYLLPYIYYSLKAFDFRPYITGMAIPHIYFKDYSKAKIWCPAVAEQKRIATTLRTMDTKLQIEHKILRNLILQKQYLLSNLFI